ncbi:hypothetical protein GOODEAATRI_005921, partial [Goodea atripinnis]
LAIVYSRKHLPTFVSCIYWHFSISGIKDVVSIGNQKKMEADKEAAKGLTRTDGWDVFAKINENSLSGNIVGEFVGNSDLQRVRWSLSGRDAHWFYLDGRDIRLNTSAEKIIDREHYNISTNATIAVQDGDDQYPQFLPCDLLFQDETSQICTSPVYRVNVTEGEEVS